jgi:hypothetical protein
MTLEELGDTIGYPFPTLLVLLRDPNMVQPILNIAYEKGKMAGYKEAMEDTNKTLNGLCGKQALAEV